MTKKEEKTEGIEDAGMEVKNETSENRSTDLTGEVISGSVEETESVRAEAKEPAAEDRAAKETEKSGAEKKVTARKGRKSTGEMGEKEPVGEAENISFAETASKAEEFNWDDFEAGYAKGRGM